MIADRYKIDRNLDFCLHATRSIEILVVDLSSPFVLNFCIKMKRFLIASSAMAIGLSPACFAAQVQTQPFQHHIVFESSPTNRPAPPNPGHFLLAQQPVDPVYIGPSTGWEDKCTYYIVRDKYGKIFDCRKCTYGGPYCFSRPS